MNLQERLGLAASPVFLMDGTAFFYRSFFAQRNLARSDGFPTNALTLLTRVLLRILREQSPRYFLFVMDGKGKNFRKEIYKEYKANREAMPEALAMQLEPVCRMVQALGIPLHVTEGCEADDCIASLSARFSETHPVIIISGDKDLKQCLKDNVIMWDPGHKEDKLLTQAVFEEQERVRPDQWADVQALIGDSSDNIPGVPGIGPKSALQIFQDYQNLEEIREHIGEIPEKLRAKLAPHLENMFLWRKLTTLLKDACSDLSLADTALRRIDLPQARSITRKFELTAIGREIEILAKAEASETLLQPEAMKVESEKAVETLAITKVAELPEKSSAVALVWPDGLDHPPLAATVESASRSREYRWEGDQAELWSWATQCDRLIVPDFKQILVKLPGLMRDEAIGRNCEVIDLALASWVLAPGSGDYSFPRLALAFEEIHGNSGPACIALNLGNSLVSRLMADGLMPLYQKLEWPLIPVLASMQINGIAIDPEEFERFLTEVQNRVDELSRAIYEEAGERFNIRSAQQLGQVLFDKLGLPSSKTTRGGQPSTSQTTLEKLAPDYPIVENILEFRKFDKLRSTYLEPLLLLKDSHNRIHSTFNQEATATGRISSSDPNLQNIPVRGELGKRMRACFVAGEGNLLIAADYSQIELRVLAHLSQDANLLAAFADREDIHGRTAALIFDRPANDITADERRMAKTINFGLLYGMGARKLSQELKITLNQAKDFIDRYFAALSGLKTFYDRILNEARDKGFVYTMAGRKRLLPEIHSANGSDRAQAERQAINTVIQGSAADIMKLAMLAVANDEALKQLDAKLILQIHDELLLEAPAAHADEAAAIVVKYMENAQPGGSKLSVPLVVDWGIGHNWAEAH